MSSLNGKFFGVIVFVTILLFYVSANTIYAQKNEVLVESVLVSVSVNEQKCVFAANLSGDEDSISYTGNSTVCKLRLWLHRTATNETPDPQENIVFTLAECGGSACVRSGYEAVFNGNTVEAHRTTNPLGISHARVWVLEDVATPPPSDTPIPPTSTFVFPTETPTAPYTETPSSTPSNTPTLTINTLTPTAITTTPTIVTTTPTQTRTPVLTITATPTQTGTLPTPTRTPFETNTPTPTSTQTRTQIPPSTGTPQNPSSPTPPSTMTLVTPQVTLPVTGSETGSRVALGSLISGLCLAVIFVSRRLRNNI